MKLSEFLKNFRLQKNMSQEDFSNAVGVSYVTINRIENENCHPSYITIKKIANYCGVDEKEIREML